MYTIELHYVQLRTKYKVTYLDYADNQITAYLAVMDNNFRRIINLVSPMYSWDHYQSLDYKIHIVARDILSITPGLVESC